MTSLLKHGAYEDAQALEWRAAAAPVITPEPDPIALELAALRREIANLHKQLHEAAEKLVEETTLTRAEGRQEAEAAFKRDESAALERLEAGIADAAAGWEDRISDIEGYAALLAQTALEGVFERTNSLTAFIGEAIAKQIAGLRQDTIIRVSVSTSDFTDAQSLGALAQRLGSCEIMQDGALESGVCRIDLRLGHIDLSIPRYWREIQALFQSWLADGAP